MLGVCVTVVMSRAGLRAAFIAANPFGVGLAETSAGRGCRCAWIANRILAVAAGSAVARMGDTGVNAERWNTSSEVAESAYAARY